VFTYPDQQLLESCWPDQPKSAKKAAAVDLVSPDRAATAPAHSENRGLGEHHPSNGAKATTPPPGIETPINLCLDGATPATTSQTSVTSALSHLDSCHRSTVRLSGT
jgi:hypothetical protein